VRIYIFTTIVFLTLCESDRQVNQSVTTETHSATIHHLKLLQNITEKNNIS